MTIDEAIAHAREVANEQKRRSGICVQNDSECDKFSACLKCAEEHEQITEWLEELKAIKEMDLSIPQHFTKEQSDWIKAYCIKRNIESYNEAIDDLIAKCENAKFAESDEIALSDIHTGVNSGLSMSIHLAEQLKAGGENEQSI